MIGPAPAKINLALVVGPRRSDGKHELVTVFQRVDLGDRVRVEPAAEKTGFHPVSREVFRPRPNVESALVAFRRVGPGAPPHVKRVVEGAFGHRRKTLANALALSGLASRERATDALAAIGRAANARAEELTPPEFVSLAEALA